MTLVCRVLRWLLFNASMIGYGGHTSRACVTEVPQMPRSGEQTRATRSVFTTTVKVPTLRDRCHCSIFRNGFDMSS